MEITESKRGDILLLSLKGRMDANTSGALETALNGLIDKGGTKFVIACAELEYISSAGLRILLLVSKKLAPMKGRMVLAATGKSIRNVLSVTGFSNIFSQFETVEEALASFGA